MPYIGHKARWCPAPSDMALYFPIVRLPMVRRSAVRATFASRIAASAHSERKGTCRAVAYHSHFQYIQVRFINPIFFWRSPRDRRWSTPCCKKIIKSRGMLAQRIDEAISGKRFFTVSNVFPTNDRFRFTQW